MELVASGFGDDVHGSRRMVAVLGGKGIGLHLELLHGIGEGQRQILVAERIVMRPAIQEIRHRAHASAANGDGR